MAESFADHEKLSVPQSPSSILGWISVTLALLLFIGGIALHLAYHISIADMWPLLVVFGVTGMLMALQKKWRPRVESMLRDKPRAWVWLGIILAGAYAGIFLFDEHPWFFFLNYNFTLNLLLIALYAEAVHQERFRIFSVTALTIGWIVTIAYFYVIGDAISGFILMALLIGAIFLPKSKGGALPIAYRLIPIVFLSGFFLFGLRPYQYSRLFALFSTAPEGMGYQHSLYQKAFELGGAWGTDMGLNIETDMQVPAGSIGDISVDVLPLLGYWKGWVIAVVAVLAMLALICLLFIQISKSRSGPLKTFSLGAVAFFSVSLAISVVSTTPVLPFTLAINYGFPFLGFSFMTLLGIILVGLSWYEGNNPAIPCRP